MRALVEIVGDAVAVGIERAAIGAHCDALRRTGATIEVVRDTVAVGVVGRATVGIDLGALRRGRALVEVLRHTFTVGIERAAVDVDLHRPEGSRVGTGWVSKFKSRWATYS